MSLSVRAPICGKLDKATLVGQSLVGAQLNDCERLSKSTLESCDLQRAVLDGLLWDHAVFKNVDFSGASMRDFNDRGNFYEHCRFRRTDLRGATVGFEGSQFIDCVFDRPRLTNVGFIRPTFVRCEFTGALSDVDFQASAFIECKFVGRIDGGWFRDGYVFESLNGRFGTPKQNRMDRVDFRKAVLWGTSFSGNLDLSTILLPEDGEHHRFDHWPERLRNLRERSLGDEHLRTAVKMFVDIFEPSAARQNQCIVYAPFVAHIVRDHGAAQEIIRLLSEKP
jgi:uncharacterized protein YjbI with pentapeptide repeats